MYGSGPRRESPQCGESGLVSQGCGEGPRASAAPVAGLRTMPGEAHPR